MPSSLTTLLPLALESSSYLPVSVCGTGTSELHVAFLATFHACLRYFFPSIATGTHSRLKHFSCVPMLNSYGGDGISTVCASATPSGLTLAPAYLGRTNLPLETLDFRPLRFSRNSRYLFRHSLLCTIHDCFRYRFAPYTTLPYPASYDAA